MDYDPSLLHYWVETRRRGEWPTTTASPACTPSIIRLVSTSTADDPTPNPDAAVCIVCAEVAHKTGGIRATCDTCGFRVVWAPGVGPSGGWTHVNPRLSDDHSPVVTS
jgi:hypothetical protein